MVTTGDVIYSELHQIAGAEFDVDGQIEQGKLPHAFCQLKTYSDRPDLLEA